VKERKGAKSKRELQGKPGQLKRWANENEGKEKNESPKGRGEVVRGKKKKRGRLSGKKTST